MKTPRMQDSELAISEEEMLLVYDQGPDDDDDSDGFLEEGDGFELDEFDSLDDFDDFDDDDDDYLWLRLIIENTLYPNLITTSTQLLQSA